MPLSEIKTITKKLSVEFGFKNSALNPLILFLFNQYYCSICSKDSKRVFSTIRKISFLDKKLYFYLVAHYLFLNAHFSSAIQYLDRLLSIDPKHTSAIYLKAKCLNELHRKDQAIELLIKSLEVSNRKKTWLIWANLITEDSEFFQFKRYWEQKNHDKHDWSLINYLVTAGLRSQQYDYTLSVLEQSFRKIKQNQLRIGLPNQFHPIHQKNAELALSQLNQVFDKNQIEFFLISGTLLGLIRENKILGHDKDLDIGIWTDYSLDFIKSLIYKTGSFEILPIRSPKVIRIRHFSNVCIDIFFHEKLNNKIIHGGVKSIWENSAFDLETAHFLNNNYLIPQNFDTYLTENYGSDWRTPKLDFDSSIDTPNITITNNAEMLAYCYQKLFVQYALKNHAACEMYMKQIETYKKTLT